MSHTQGPPTNLQAGVSGSPKSKETGEKGTGTHMAALSQVPSKERGGTRHLLATCHLFVPDILAFSELLLHLPGPLITNIPGALQQGSELNTEVSFQNCSKC